MRAPPTYTPSVGLTLIMDPGELAFLDILPSLTDAVALEPSTFANELLKRSLIPRRTWQVALSATMDPVDKSNQIMVALQTRLSSDTAAVKRLLEAFRAVPTLATFADRMQSAMGQGKGYKQLSEAYLNCILFLQMYQVLGRHQPQVMVIESVLLVLIHFILTCNVHR